MASFTTFSCFATLTFLVFCLKISAVDESSSFFFQGFGKDRSFEENIGLNGDAKVANGGSWIQLRKGGVVYKKPINLLGGKERNLASFSTYFSFSMSNESGIDGGLAFVLVPLVLLNHSLSDKLSLGFEKNRSEVVAVEFEATKDYKIGVLNGSRVGIDVGRLVSAKVMNVSSVSRFVLSNGDKLHCWVDYEASSKRLEVRLSKSSDIRPVDPLLSYSIDLSKIWKDEEMLVGFTSSNGDSSQTSFIYSWSFKLRHFRHWMHSQPVDPKEISMTEMEEPLVVRKRSDYCLWRTLGALVLGAACGALGAFLVLYLCTMLGSRRPMAVVPEECAVKPVDFGYKKVEVLVLDKAVEEGGKK